MTSAAILKRIRLLIPAKLDGHYKAVCRAFEEGDLTAPACVPTRVGILATIAALVGRSNSHPGIRSGARRTLDDKAG